MNTWIFSDSEDLILRIRSTLQELNIACHSTRIASVASADRLSTSGEDEAAIVFLATECISGETIEAIHQIRSFSSKVPLAVVSQTDDHGAILKSIRAGADDFLNADETLPKEIEGFVRRVSSSNSRHVSHGKQFCIVPCHVPTDASLLGVNMCAAIAKRADRCCLVDLQMRGGDAALLLNLAPKHTIYDLLTQPHPVDGAMLGQALAQHESGIELLASPALFSNLQSIQPRLCEDILRAAQSTHNFVVVISEDIQHAEQLWALAGSDLVILTTRLDLPSLQRTHAHVEYLARNNISVDHLKVVAMCTGHRGELPLAEVKKVLRMERIVCVPDDPVAITVSINVGNPIVLDSPRSKTSNALIKFVNSLVGWEETSERTANTRTWTVAKSAAASVAHMFPFCR